MPDSLFAPETEKPSRLGLVAAVIVVLALTAGGVWYRVQQNEAEADRALARAVEAEDLKKLEAANIEARAAELDSARQQKIKTDSEAAEKIRQEVRDFRNQMNARPLRYQFEKLLDKAEELATHGATSSASAYLDEAEALFPGDALTRSLRDKIPILEESKKAIETARQNSSKK